MTGEGAAWCTGMQVPLQALGKRVAQLAQLGSPRLPAGFTAALPTSNSSGMRLAKRWMLRPGLMFLPPTLTAASTMKAWPSCTPTGPCGQEGAVQRGGSKRSSAGDQKHTSRQWPAEDMLDFYSLRCAVAPTADNNTQAHNNTARPCLVCGHHLWSKLLHDAQPQIVLACTAGAAEHIRARHTKCWLGKGLTWIGIGVMRSACKAGFCPPCS